MFKIDLGTTCDVLHSCLCCCTKNVLFLVCKNCEDCKRSNLSSSTFFVATNLSCSLTYFFYKCYSKCTFAQFIFTDEKSQLSSIVTVLVFVFNLKWRIENNVFSLLKNRNHILPFRTNERNFFFVEFGSHNN